MCTYASLLSPHVHNYVGKGRQPHMQNSTGILKGASERSKLTPCIVYIMSADIYIWRPLPTLMMIFTCLIDDLLPNIVSIQWFLLPRAYRLDATLILEPSAILFIISCTCRCLDGIPECVIAQFHEAAEELIGEKGATSAVAAALAYIAGAKDIISRSLLSAHQACHNNIIMAHVYMSYLPTCG